MPDYLGLDGLQVSDRLLRHLLSVSEASTAPILNRYLQTGVNGAAIVSGILAADDIEAEVRKFKTID